MKVIISENSQKKILNLFQVKIDELFNEIKERYRNEQISASNRYLSTFSKIDKVIVRNVKFKPDLSIYVEVYSDDSRFDEDDIQEFANYLRHKLDYIGNPWIVPILINDSIED